MDPFNQVYKDALSQMSIAEQLLQKYESAPSTFHVEDLNNAIQELVETIHDLSQSTGAIQSQPQKFGLTIQDVQNRISQVGALNSQLMDLQDHVINIRKQHGNNSESHMFSDSSQKIIQNDFLSRSETPEIRLESSNNTTTSLIYQQELNNQDNMLDSVYQTVNSLNQQANLMSQELAEQSVLIEDFDRQVDTAQDRLRRGMKKVDWVIRHNQETLGSCCITLLIIVLIILLVLLLVL